MECQTPTYLSKQEICVPCGRCAFCTATLRSDWATRLHYESRLHLDSYFITLTYSDNNLRWKNGISQLDKRDLQLWFKRVRKAGYKVRYYAVGEYGSKTFRPHYHILLFGYVPEQVIRKTWDLGLVHIGRITQASIMYALGYIVNGKGWKMRTKRNPPFSLMSRKPGLGHNYLTPAMKAWHLDDLKNYVIVEGKKRHLPRYYKGKIFEYPIQRVRIAVRSGKELFKKQVAWLRHPLRQKMRNPCAYRDAQLKALADRIRAKSKINISI